MTYTCLGILVSGSSVYFRSQLPSKYASKYTSRSFPFTVQIVVTLSYVPFMYLLLLLLNRTPCPDVMQIVGRWCYKNFTEAKETLDYVP